MLSNPAVTTLFGYDPGSLVGEPIEVLVPRARRAAQASQLECCFEAPRARPTDAGLELTGRHLDGRELALEVRLAPFEVRGARYAAAFVRDAHEHERGVERLNAINEITQRLLGGTRPRDILTLVASWARRLSSADAVWIVTPASSGELQIVAVDGAGTEPLLGSVLSATTSHAAEVMHTGNPEVIDDLSAAADVPAATITLGLGPGLYVPLIANERRLGLLVLGRVRSARAFEPVEVAFAEVFASATAAAIELSEVRSELERHGIVAEDERIARDLHDTVIQQLFAIGLAMQSAQRMASGVLRERIEAAITDLDAVIGDIRTTIFALPRRSASATGVRDQMLRLADEYREELGFTPRTAFHGPVDTVVPTRVSDHLLQVLSEALSNVARHAAASCVEVVVVVRDGWLALSVLDDGVGIAGGPSAGLGLHNMLTRAENLDGTCALTRRDPTGTVLEWRVPI